MESNNRVRMIVIGFCLLSVLSTIFLYSQSLVINPSLDQTYSIEGVNNIKMLPDVALVKEIVKSLFNIAKP